MAYSLSLMYGSASYIYLDGAGIAAPVKGCQYSPGRGKTASLGGLETITEQITLDLSGTYRQIADWISAINVQLENFKAGAWHESTTGPLVLRFVEPDEAGAYYWFSRVFDAWLELDASGLAQRKAGQQKVSLMVTRENRWEYSNTQTSLVINFPGGGTQLTYGGLLNHRDATAGHSNWGWINPVSGAGDLAARMTLQLQPAAGDYVGDVYVGLGWSDVPEPNIQYALPTLEESAFTAGVGVTKTNAADASCSGGNYATFAWPAVVETLLMTATIPSTLYANNLAWNRPFKPLARLQTAWAVTDCWFKAQVRLGGTATVIYETEWFLFPGGTQMLEFPPVYLPPSGLQENYSLDLAIFGMKTTAGAYSLPFDCCQLWPVDGGFRKYKQLAYIASAGQLVDNGPFGNVFWANLALTQRRASVVAYGPALELLPGRTIVVALVNLTNGTAWLIDDKIYTILNLAPTKRNI